MSRSSAPPLHAVFGALADPTRLAIVERLLREGERSAGDIAEPFAMSKPAISKHLRVLEDAGLIERRIDRQWRVCRTQPEAIRELEAWIFQPVAGGTRMRLVQSLFLNQEQRDMHNWGWSSSFNDLEQMFA